MGTRTWARLYLIGGVSAIVVLIGIVADLIIGTVTGGNLTALPQTAVGRFEQLRQNMWLGLYNLDLLNMIVQLIQIPVWCALFAVHRETDKAMAGLAFVVFLTGTIMLALNNSALIMLQLSNGYANAAEGEKMLFAAAGEGALARGAHGGFNALPGFLLPNVAGLIMSFVMLKGRIFSQSTALLGIAGSALISIYLCLVTFVPAVKGMATIVAAPGGLMLIAWMVAFTGTLLRLGRNGGQSGV